MHAQIASMIEELDGPGCGYGLALFAKRNHKCVPMDSTFVRKIVYHRLVLLGRGTCNTKREHLEAFLFEPEPKKQQYGSNKQ